MKSNFNEKNKYKLKQQLITLKVKFLQRKIKLTTYTHLQYLTHVRISCIVTMFNKHATTTVSDS